MLPRQYGVKSNNAVFPSMNHISVALLNQIPTENAVRYAITECMKAHPLLRAHIEGNGEPDKRIDLFQMVREGDNNPCTFVASDDDKSKFGYTSDDVLKIIDIDVDDDDDDDDQLALERSWKKSFVQDLDNGSATNGGWCDVKGGTTPLWKVELHRSNSNLDNDNDNKAALLLSFNHAISDQSSACRLTDQLLTLISDYEENKTNNNSNNDNDIMMIRRPTKQEIPPSVEESVLGRNNRYKDVQTTDITINTIKYVAGKAFEETKAPVILPDAYIKERQSSSGGGLVGAVTTITGNAAGGDDATSTERKSVVTFRTLSKDTTQALLESCRTQNVSITNALSAAMTLTSSDFVGMMSSSSSSSSDDVKERNYKILQSLDMRRFGEQVDQGVSVGCLAGSMDLVHESIQDNSGMTHKHNNNKDNDSSTKKLLWKVANEGKEQTNAFIDTNNYPEEAVRVFDFAMTISDLNNLVHLTAQSKDSQGRAYSAGFTNAGVYEKLSAFQYDNDNDNDITTTNEIPTRATTTSTRHGKYQINDIYYAASNARSGSLYRMSCLTINDEIKLTFHPAAPIVNEDTNEQFANSFIKLLELVASSDSSEEDDDLLSLSPIESLKQFVPKIPKNSLVGAVSIWGVVAVGSHWTAYTQFFTSIMEMKSNIDAVDAADFWAALNFWIFFAVAHPILQPILWISDVLHGSPGPMILGDHLVPLTFLLGNVVAIAAFTYVKEIRNAVNVGALFAFVAYVGAGLSGQAGLGDFNLSIDDSYTTPSTGKTQIVKGCPAYEDVRQPSMDDFNLEKYQGLWYEQKFHDWTQFKEVYDTTLDIKLTDGGQGWIDDFAVKGPAPKSAKLSWDKSPVANGAHYFLFGRVDSNDPKGVLREKGFGVEFPNYIVDVLKDPDTGDYKEAIQFQCLERGGVRVFEGINFMSKNSVMSNDELTAMHQRAEKAGMYPYGASPEQMHTVARRPVDAPPIDNNWQAMWRAIGVDKLLELLTESIEDGGR